MNFCFQFERRSSFEWILHDTGFSGSDKRRHRPSFLSAIQSSLIYLLLLFLGHRLTKHVFIQHKTASVTECAQYCVREISACKSINYKSRRNQDSSKNCQLNNATKFIQPQSSGPYTAGGQQGQLPPPKKIKLAIFMLL
jgi:hypothetical protein